MARKSMPRITKDSLVKSTVSKAFGVSRSISLKSVKTMT